MLWNLWDSMGVEGIQPMATRIKTTSITFNQNELYWLDEALSAMFPENYTEEEFAESTKVLIKIRKAYERRFVK